MTAMLRLATITFYDQSAWLTKIGLLPGSISYVELNRSRHPTIAQIKVAVSEYFRIPLIEMTSARRARWCARPRQVAMYLTKAMTHRSLPEIGRAFGDRDHTTVIHAVRQITKLMVTDDDIALAVAELTKRLDGGRG